jgi:hypothetical protein
VKWSSDIPISPAINNMNAPTYKVAKHLVGLLNRHLTLKNHYNVKNSTNLAIDLTKLKLNKNHKLITYDIKKTKRKFVTMHGHMNVKNKCETVLLYILTHIFDYKLPTLHNGAD